MSDLATALHARLIGTPEVSSLVATRVYPGIRPQKSPLPAIRLQFASNIAERHLKGEDEMQAARVQIDCFALTFSASWQLAQAVKTALLAPATVGGVAFGAGEIEGPVTDSGDDTPDGHIYWTRLDLLVRYRLA